MRLLDFLPNKRLIVDVTDKKRILAEINAEYKGKDKVFADNLLKIAEGFRQRFAVDEQLKFSRRPRRLPRGHPIARPHPDVIRAGGGKWSGCHRVLHRHAETVREEIRRAHLIHGLLVHIPAAQIRKLLGFQKNILAAYSGG